MYVCHTCSLQSSWRWAHVHTKVYFFFLNPLPSPFHSSSSNSSSPIFILIDIYNLSLTWYIMLTFIKVIRFLSIVYPCSMFPLPLLLNPILYSFGPLCCYTRFILLPLLSIHHYYSLCLSFASLKWEISDYEISILLFFHCHLMESWRYFEFKIYLSQCKIPRDNYVLVIVSYYCVYLYFLLPHKE